MGSYLSIITLNVNGLDALTKRQRLAEWIKKQDPYIAVYKRPTSKQGHIQTESEGLEKAISCKWRPKESRSSNTHIRQNRLLNKGRENRQRTLHNDQRINPRRRYNNYKCICTQHRSTSIRKTSMKGEMQESKVIV